MENSEFSTAPSDSGGAWSAVPRHQRKKAPVKAYPTRSKDRPTKDPSETQHALDKMRADKAKRKNGENLFSSLSKDSDSVGSHESIAAARLLRPRPSMKLTGSAALAREQFRQNVLQLGSPGVVGAVKPLVLFANPERPRPVVMAQSPGNPAPGAVNVLPRRTSSAWDTPLVKSPPGRSPLAAKEIVELTIDPDTRIPPASKKAECVDMCNLPDTPDTDTASTGTPQRPPRKRAKSSISISPCG